MAFMINTLASFLPQFDSGNIIVRFLQESFAYWGAGQLRLLPYIPDRSKQHSGGRQSPRRGGANPPGRTFLIRPPGARVRACLAEPIQ